MQYLFTERAHLMCPHMCFGIAAAVSRPYDENRVKGTIDRLAAAHPFLTSLLGYEEKRNAYFYNVTGQSKVELFVKNTVISGIDAPEIPETYQEFSGRDWDLFREGMLKIAVWPMESGTCFLLVFHHLLADGRGALMLTEELADSYVSDLEPEASAERLITSADDFPENSDLPAVSRLLVRRANAAWAKEHHLVSSEEYHRFADEFLKNDPVTYSFVQYRQEELDAVRQACHENRVSVNDWLLAKMMKEEEARKIIMACDLRSRLPFYRKGALGNYSTAFSVALKKKPDELWALAKAVHTKVRQIMDRPSDLYLVLQCYAALDPGLLDAALISCRGNYPSKAGRFIGGMFFGFKKPVGHSVTNLGRIESGSIKAAFFIPPASPAMKKTQGVLTVNGIMTVCTAGRE